MRPWLTLILAAFAAFSQTSYNVTHAWWEPGQDEFFPWDADYDTATGLLRVSSPKGSFRTGGHPFFRPLGANGRACVTCHQPSNAMSLSVENIRRRWSDTGGRDPLFASVDGANCPTLPPAARDSHSLLLDRGLFRVALPWPPPGITPDFRIEVLRDPTGCNRGSGEISVYRRPRMSANLLQLTPGPAGPVLMADGRAPSLRAQAIDAILVHEQAAAAPSDADLQRILDFELQVTANQFADSRGGLTAKSNSPKPASSAASGSPSGGAIRSSRRAAPAATSRAPPAGGPSPAPNSRTSPFSESPAAMAAPSPHRIPAAPSSPESARTSAPSSSRNSEVSPPARRTSPTARPPRWKNWSTPTANSASPSSRKKSGTWSTIF